MKNMVVQSEAASLFGTSSLELNIMIKLHRRIHDGMDIRTKQYIGIISIRKGMS